jgi:hypothetical protein
MLGHDSLDAGDVRFRSVVANGMPQRFGFVLLSLPGKADLESNGSLHGRSEDCKAQKTAFEREKWSFGCDGADLWMEVHRSD